MNLTDIHIVPHYNKLKFEKLEERCQQYENENACKLVRLNDGEGIAIAFEH